MRLLKGGAFLLLLIFICSTTALAAKPLSVVASFSILGDMVTQVGGEYVKVTTLVGPDGDPHVFEPSPADARTISQADVVVINGLGLEGWFDRLIKASGFKGRVVVASQGITTRAMQEEEHAHKGGHGHDHDGIDPHAWQNLANGKIYVQNIAATLIAVDPADKAAFEKSEQAYLTQLDHLDTWVKAQFAGIPQAKRRMITSHDAFGYFADAYGVQILSPQGVSTASEASAGAIRKLIRQIRQEKITAVFIENISDPRLVDEIARESKVHMGGELYSDALSKKDGPAPTYIAMFHNNVDKIVAAMRQGL